MLDPFCGTGTTAAAAKRLGRRFITIDREDSYIEVARNRVADVMTPMLMEEGVFVDAPKPRVSFASLVESGRLRVGEVLLLKGRKISAQIQEDGTLTANGLRGSIHRLGALLLNLPSCNGWTHWYFHDHATGEPHLIDALRPHGYEVDAAP